MKINQIGNDVVFSEVEKGQIIWFLGAFYMKIEKCTDLYEDESHYNCVNLENGALFFFEPNEWVCVYPTANLNLV